MSQPSSKDVEIPNYLDAVSSVSFHPSNPDLLLSSSWDSTVKLHQISTPEDASGASTSDLKLTAMTQGAVLDTCFGTGGSENKAYAGGLSKLVSQIDLETEQQTILGTHRNGVRCVKWVSDMNALLTGSWDATVSVFDPRSSTPSSGSGTTGANTTLPLPAKVYSLDAAKGKVVVGMGDRRVWIWDTRWLADPESRLIGEHGEAEAWQKRESSLKFMTRCVRCMPGGEGYALGSIEGRVAVEFFDPSPVMQAKKYAFKCHRQNVEGTDTVYPVNALAFHPIHGTFATGGGDAVVSIWDPLAKKRLRQFPKYASSISSLSFNSDGTRLAIGCCLMEEEGSMRTGEGRNTVYVRAVKDDCKPKK